jgi:hypothetical protein
MQSPFVAANQRTAWRANPKNISEALLNFLSQHQSSVHLFKTYLVIVWSLENRKLDFFGFFSV